MAVIGPGRLKILLSAEDLAELSIPREQIDKSDPATRKALVRLLQQAKETAGFRPKNSRLLVKILPAADDGCVIYITAVEKDQAERAAMSAVVFAFADVDDLCRGAIGLYSRYGHRIYKSLLYRIRGQYRLILHPLDCSDQLSVYFLSEYAGGIYRDPVLAAFIEEHGEAIAPQNAIDCLAHMFGDPEDEAHAQTG